MDPGTALLLSAGSSIFGGFARRSKARAEQRRARINSYIGRTRAIQTDTSAREGLEEELGSIRNVMAASQQRGGVGTLEMLNELREIRDRDRRIRVGNRRSEAADWRVAGQNAGMAARGAVLGGFFRAGPSLVDYYQYRTRDGTN